MKTNSTLLEKKKDYIVVKDPKTAYDIARSYKGRSLRGKWIIIAPKGLRLIPLEDLLRLPQISQAIKEAKEEERKLTINKTKKLLKSIIWESEWQKVNKFLQSLKSKPNKRKDKNE